ELLEPLLGALEPLAQRRRLRGDLRVSELLAAEDLGDVTPREVAVEPQQDQLVLLGIELLAQLAERVLDVRALELVRVRADDGSDLGRERERDGTLAMTWRAPQLAERVARQHVEPRAQRRLPAKLGQAAPQILGELCVGLGGE